jgi:VIT1/CCC1 family predicted Fe2+/Mn2+ transporter
VPEEQQEKHPHLPGRHIIDRVVLGGSDGMIEGIAATAALNGAGVDFRTILIAGFAFAVAGALSMFFSNYLSGKSMLDSLRIDIERERMEIETEPEEERKELEGLLRKEGYGQKEVDVIMAKLTKDKDMWLRAQLRHELHLHVDELQADPLTRSAPAGGAYFLAAIVPLVPYFFQMPHFSALLSSVALVLAALFLLGSMKFLTLAHFSMKKGAESALVGALAAVLLYAVGKLVSLI